MNLFEDLKWRGLVYQTTDEEGLVKLLENEKVSLYCGFDPTADSIHIGHLLPLLTLKRFENYGHKPIALIGGGTGLIGDPSGKTSERNLNTIDTVKGYVECFKEQFSRVLDFDKSELANNYEWLKDLSAIEFLRDYGRHFSINTMMTRDSVKSRLENGLSYLEFSYMILQSIDFLKLHESHNCKLQIGGQDQWGNMVSGTDLIRRCLGPNRETFAFTMPLVTKSDGTKFGKTESGAVWLDINKTSAYEFYQFWYNVADIDVVKYLKFFTFLSVDEISELEKKVSEEPHLREAQKTLAREVLTLIHGEEAFNSAIRISEALFSGNISSLSASEIAVGFKDVPSVVLNESQNLVDTLITAGAAKSKREAREFISNNSISVNGEKVNDEAYVVSKDNAIGEEFTVIRRGKKKYFMIKHK